MRRRLKVSTVRQNLMSDGSEFQVREAATENARRASSLCVLGFFLPPCIFGTVEHGVK